MGKENKDELRKMRYNNNIMEKMDSAIYILPKGIIIIKATENEKLGIYIEEESIAKIQKKIFEQMWKISK